MQLWQADVMGGFLADGIEAKVITGSEARTKTTLGERAGPSAQRTLRHPRNVPTWM